MNIRMGLHVHSNRADHLVERFVREVRPSVMKWLDGDINSGLVKLAHSLGALTILRVYERNQDWSADGQARYLARVEEAMVRWPFFDAYEVSYNEAGQKGGELAVKAAMDIRGMELAERHRKRAVVGNFSTGGPEVHEWHFYLPALQRAAAWRHLVGLHEYGGGPAGMLWGVGENQVGGRVDDPCPGPRLPGYWCLRYRRALEQWQRLGLADSPEIVITEGGIDHVDPCPASTPGYKLAAGTHAGAIGDYAAQWAWYCRQLAADRKVVGAVDFGFADASGEWGQFDLSTDPETFERLVAAMRRLPAGSTAEPTPRPTTPPAPPIRPPIPVPPLKAMPGQVLGVQPRLQVQPREGWIALARRALGREPAHDEVERMKAANGPRLDVHAGDWVLSPFHRLERAP